jgi:NADPH-dependent 7-cyano-7-deazaguanine reductase QueF
MWQYRDQAEFNEVLVDKICTAFHTQLRPGYIKVTGEFAIRGGIWVKAESQYVI